MAKAAGATVLSQPIQGYGNACLKGLEYVFNKGKADHPDIVVFIDADYSDYPEEMYDVINPIIKDNMDMVIGSRALGDLESGSMTLGGTDKRLHSDDMVFVDTNMSNGFYGVKLRNIYLREGGGGA